MSTQFLSAFADNALLLLVIAVLQSENQAAFWIPLIKVMFTLSYVISGPWVGAWSDHQAKHKVMMFSNGIKVFACCALIFGLNPILCFAITGLGAALYAPAKYGLVTEIVNEHMLVRANAWIEVSAVCAALFGFMLGGALVADTWVSSELYSSLAKFLPVHHSFNVSMTLVLLIYLSSALLNRKIPDSGCRYPKTAWELSVVWNHFLDDQKKLWHDPLARTSLSVTSLFWGIGATMQLLVLAWAQSLLQLNLTQSAYLQAASAIGVMLGATLASHFVSLKNAPRVLLAGICLGCSLPIMVMIHDWTWALMLTLILGALGGFFVVPMNALLQARGVKLLSAGRSISVQNTCENSSVLLLLCVYSAMVYFQLSVETLIWALAGLIVTGMSLVTWQHHRNHT